jgi:8-oxo-dGTP pyrophosphatase MutT (NUDIX family)
MTWRPHLTVAALAERDGHMLVVEELIRGQRVLNQPAGHVEDGESILEAVIRETLEETAYHFQPTHVVGTYLWRNPEDGRTTLRFALAGQITGHDASRQLDHGIVAAHWLPPERLREPGAPLRSPLVLRCIDDFLEGRRFDLKLLAQLTD